MTATFHVGDAIEAVKYPTLIDFKSAWAALTESQQEWVKAKCRWEHMSRWSVMNEWDLPAEEMP